MRKPQYLSPSALKIFYDNRELYYMQYLSDAKRVRDPQTPAMAVGSAFDAYVKGHLYKQLVGKGDPQFSFEALFESQVEPHNRTQARIDGKKIFEFYMQCGALSDLLLDMTGCIGEPRFETRIEGSIKLDNLSVPLLGKPDIYFLTPTGARIIFDWKVNGYYSKAPVSPKPGYKKTRPDGAVHDKFWPMVQDGYTINCHPFENVDEEWALQLATYSWLLGEPIGSKTIMAIDQIACNNKQGYMRVAQHRGLVSQEYQVRAFKMYEHCWSVIQSGHIFENMSREESDAKCKVMDNEDFRGVL